MRRFYFNPDECREDEITLSSEESHHLVKVLRLSVGSEIELLDGTGRIFLGRVAAVGRRVSVRLGMEITQAELPDRQLWLAQGLLKGDKMETVIQKATELGVNRFCIVQTDRVQGRLNAAQQQKKMERWQRIMLESCKQCRRSNLMQLDFAADLDVFQHNLPVVQEKDSRLLFWEEEHERKIAALPDLKVADPLLLLLGPEGGLSESEVARMQQSGFLPVSMGERILRAETATLAALAIVQFLRGNI
jgi:16S rRNA (uracil1498-N3)-methyltransferase